jgi:hypothetical protein
VALFLRLWGFEQGYPDFYGHVDEIGVAASVWNYFRVWTLQPTEFTYPAFYSYLVAAGLSLTHLFGWGPKLHGFADTLAIVSYIDPARAALVGRAISAIFAAMIPLVAYGIGRRAYGDQVAWIGAVFVAVSLLPVVQAHQALPDSTMAFCAIVCFYFSWQIYERGRWSDYALAGIAAGLVVASKFNGAFTALAIPAAHWMSYKSDASFAVLFRPKLWLAIVLASLALLAGSPYLLLAHDKYWAVASYQVSSLDFALGERQPWWWIIRSLVQMEWLLGSLLVAGLLWSFYRREPQDWIFLAVWLPSFLYIGSWTRESMHYLLHCYPLLALGAARLLVIGVGCWDGKGRARTVYGLAFLCVLPSLFQVQAYNRKLREPDLRQMASAWIRAELPDQTRLAMNWFPYCPRVPLVKVRQQIANQYAGDPQALTILQEAWAGTPSYTVDNLEIWLKRPVVPEFYRDKVDLTDQETNRVFRRGWLSPRQLRQRGVEYVVLPEAAYGRFVYADPPSVTEGAAHYHFAKNRAYFSNLIDPNNPETEEVVRFESQAGTRGASIAIYRLH